MADAVHVTYTHVGRADSSEAITVSDENSANEYVHLLLSLIWGN